MKNNILVIEEKKPDFRNRIVSALDRQGFNVAVASSYEEALLKLDKLRPELIILGDGLSLDSFEACEQFRQRIDSLILMLGTVPNALAWTQAVESGADFYLGQPFSSRELLSRVKALLRRHQITKSNGKRKLAAEK